jgi:hypothetical protein
MIFHMITATKRTRKDFRDRNYLIAIEIVITDLQVLETCFSCLKKNDIILLLTFFLSANGVTTQLKYC